MAQKTVHFETLGCRLNQDETEGAAHSFLAEGFLTDLEPLTARSPIQENVVLGVVNTCTVTGKAEQKARRIIRLLLEKCPNAIVIVTGCYAEVDSSSIKQIGEKRIAVLPGTKKYLLSSIAKHFSVNKNNKQKKILIGDVEDLIESFCKEIESSKDESNTIITQNKKTNLKLDAFTLYTPVFEKHSRASIKIEDGCNNSCAFCRIHLARGKAVSLSVPEVLKRVKLLEENGVNEVVFTGVNLSQYSGLKYDDPSRKERASFAELLTTLLVETKNIRFRISSFYPQYIDESFCNAIKDERVQPSFHLSIQSGSNRILSLMNRPYTAEVVLNAIRMIRNAKCNPFIACDIIAGFPGETEEDFELTKEMCKKASFSWIHAFPFSPRPGTVAYNMKPAIPERVKGERVAVLTDIAVKGKIAYINSFAGKKVTAIVENSRSLRLSKNNPFEKKYIHAVTSNFIHVQCEVSNSDFSSGRFVPGALISVEIARALEENIKSGEEIEAVATINF